MSGYSFYSRLMTVNMDGKAKPDESRALVSEIIKSEASSLVFCQELPGYFETDVVPNDYKFVETIVKTKRKHAAVMWSRQHFHRKPVDGIKEISDTLVKLKIIDDEIPTRTAVVRLTAKREEAFNFPPFLAVSWHGPYSGKKSWTLENKQKALKGLILFLHEVCRRCAEDVSLIITGGDFNLNTLDENGLGRNVYFPPYTLTHRAAAKLENNRKKIKGRPYIPYKDNFAIITISPSVGRPFVDMKLSKVKPLSEFNYMKEEGSQGSLNGTRRVVGFAWGSDFICVLVRLILYISFYFLYITNISGISEKGKDILDHDPIIGFLQLRKTPSTGKFWLS